MTEITKERGFWEKVDRWVTAATAIPVFGIVLKKLFESVAEKGADKLQKKIEKALGTLSEAKKDVTDEVLYNVAAYSLSEAEADELDSFEIRLRLENKEQAEAFVLYIAKIIQMFERETTKATNPKKGESGPRVEQKYKKLEEGIERAQKILKALLKKTGADDNATFKARVAYLEGKNVFSLIQAKKEPSKILAVAKEFGNKTADKAKSTGGKIVDNQKTNFSDLSNFASSANATAKQRLQDAINSRRR